MTNKPTGNEGANRVIIKEDGSAVLSFERSYMGTDKADIERQIMARFSVAWHKLGASFTYEQNGENDLDFTIKFADETLVDMDLTEFILPADKGAPFNQPNRAYTFGMQADAIEHLVRRKDSHYSPLGRPKQLLVYTTHWPFMPTWQVLRLVQVAFLKSPPKTLENVFFLYNVGEGDCPVPLHPADPKLMENFNAEEERQRQFVRANPTSATLKT
ncbi:hypothetical protein ACRRRS_14925 [Brucella anthropi]|uniref:hypothetical protein n=1 Tax=Brucella anthropi TaxID=529 RepID=UPI003D7CA75D